MTEKTMKIEDDAYLTPAGRGRDGGYRTGQAPDRARSCCFTGHRAAKLPWGYDEADPRCLALKKVISDAITALCESGVTYFLSGMALGGDLYFAEAVLALRLLHPEVMLEAAIPCEGQERRWPEPLQSRYRQIAGECDVRTVLARRYTPDCMMRRNRYMVDRAHYLLAAYSGAPGGTRNTLRYAKQRGCEIILLPFG